VAYISCHGRLCSFGTSSLVFFLLIALSFCERSYKKETAPTKIVEALEALLEHLECFLEYSEVNLEGR